MTWLRTLLPRTLFGRTFLITVLPVALLLAVSTYIFYARHWDALSRRLAQSLAGEIDLVSRLAQGPLDDDARLILGAAQRTLGFDLHFLPPGRWPEIAALPTTARLAGLETELAGRLALPFRLALAPEREEIDIFIVLPDGRILQFSTTRKRLYSPTVLIYVVWTVGLSAVLLFTALIVLNNQIRPIRTLARAAEAFGKGQSPRRLRLHGATEVRQATHAFNDMQARIQRQMQQRTEMLSGISHDLRTPITRLRLHLSMLEEVLPTADQAAMQNDLLEMERMIEAYLAFARGEDGEPTEPLPLPKLLASVCDPVIRQGGALTLGAVPPLVLQVRPMAMRRCLANLIANACKYGQHVVVRVAVAEDAALHIHIDDDGPGIPPAQRETVFRPFYRLEASRNPATGGVGLGLSITRDIARAHGGDVVLSTAPEGGLRATVILLL
jgi:two-component system osmolarity sensor histidine kinase EnvZ